MFFKHDPSLHVQRHRISLLDGDSLYLRRREGTELRVEPMPQDPGHAAGAMLWITEEGFVDDVFLHPGESHVLRGRGRVVATAWGALQLRAVSAREAAAAAQRAHGLQRQELKSRRSNTRSGTWRISAITGLQNQGR